METILGLYEYTQAKNPELINGLIIIICAIVRFFEKKKLEKKLSKK